MTTTSTPQKDASALATSLFAHAAEKGGQGDIDREKINAIVMSLTKESKFTKEKLAHHSEAEKWAAEARRKVATLDAAQRSVAAHHVRQNEARLEASRSSRWCAVIDFDMFFAAVEIRDRPELREKPVAVGGLGMISTANYVARRWGVRSAMPGWIGQQLCRRGPEFGMPRSELVFVRPDFAKYEKAAATARDIFAEYDPDFRSYSLDEAYLDLTSHLGGAEDADPERARSALSEIRSRVRDATGGLTLSGGLGPNFRLAKIAADVNKPDGQCSVPRGREAVLAFLRDRPCRKVSGVGRVLEHKLKAGFGVETFGQLLETMPLVWHCFTPKTRDFLHRVALGVDDDNHHQDRESGAAAPKGVGNERTFEPTNDREALTAKLRDLCELVAGRLREASLRPLKCSLKLKRDDFKVTTRTAQSDGRPVDTADILEAKLRPLLEDDIAVAKGAAQRFRLIGVRTFDFAPEVVERGGRGRRRGDEEDDDDEGLRRGGATNDNKKRQPQIDAFFRTSSSSPAEKPAWRPPLPSQVDADVLDELPADIRHELGEQMGRPPRKKQQPGSRSWRRGSPTAQDDTFARLLEMGFDQTRAAGAAARAPDFPAAVDLLLH
ncbi:hypothetical protein CTAYLR_003626 [Chrysophaeum taylorii]|uniref:DNA polymerase kappa n=1 Tax=Chrysophaeum taylorii TaxID=2483200 RepID=A0AAD7XK10_9STRA|nr:hypothetical protein CTAYLR_003626 [Chrysophaeum taylorii]